MAASGPCAPCGLSGGPHGGPRPRQPHPRASHPRVSPSTTRAASCAWVVDTGGSQHPLSAERIRLAMW